MRRALFLAATLAAILAPLLPACGPAEDPANEPLDAPAVAGDAGRPQAPEDAPAGAPQVGEDPLAALRANAAEVAGREEHADPRVQVAHVLVAFEGAARSRVVGRTREGAEERAALVLRRVRAGEDFLAVMKELSDDPGPGVYTMWLGAPQGEGYPRAGMAPAFGDVGWRLAPGEVGVAPHDPEKSPFGWHVIKRLE